MMPKPAPSPEIGIEPEALSRYFRVLGDPTRLRIIAALLERERTVSELVEIVGTPRSRVSNHLACLKWCQVVSAHRHGRSVTYRIADARIRRVLDLGAALAEPNCDHLVSCARIGPDWI